MALLDGRISNSTIGSSGAPLVLAHANMPPRASQLARAKVLEYLLTNAASLDAACSRWNGCGCRDVLRWSVLNSSSAPWATIGPITLIQNAPAAQLPLPPTYGLPCCFQL